MSPITKFAVFMILAGVLAILFALVPDSRMKAIHSEKTDLLRESSGKSGPLLPSVPLTGDRKLGKTPARPAAGENKFVEKVRMPAIRGVNNYGWVELPRGTRVNLVKESGNRLWVRWDGTIVEVPNVVAASGAIVLR
ncbi:MAG: hypothetical protein WCF18_21915 [Chthoniobacteraceae bacterium]